MNCIKCGKQIRLMRDQNTEQLVPVDDLMVYVIPDDNARLKAFTRTGVMFTARLASSSDKDAVKAFMFHAINCKRRTSTREHAARSEYDRRQDAVIDARLQFQRQRAAAMRREDIREEEQIEQLRLF